MAVSVSPGGRPAQLRVVRVPSPETVPAICVDEAAAALAELLRKCGGGSGALPGDAAGPRRE